MSTVNTFTLIFKDKFIEYKITATDASLIVNLNSVVGMLMGFVVGPMLKFLGYRKVSFIGAAFFSFGAILTSTAKNPTHFYITYSVLCGKYLTKNYTKLLNCIQRLFVAIGMGLCSSSFPLAINTYFKVRRTKAFGAAMTLSGLGPIVFPLLVSFFLSYYGASGTCLVMAGIGLHVFVAASLLQPVKYHQHVVVIEVTEPIVVADRPSRYISVE